MKKWILHALLLVSLSAWLAGVAVAQDWKHLKSDSVFSIGSLAIQMPKYVSIELRNNKNEIRFRAIDGKRAILTLDSTAHYSGELPADSSAKIFFDCMLRLWSNTFRKEWERARYLTDKRDEYLAKLTKEYQKAFELYMKQESNAR